MSIGLYATNKLKESGCREGVTLICTSSSWSAWRHHRNLQPLWPDFPHRWGQWSSIPRFPWTRAWNSCAVRVCTYQQWDPDTATSWGRGYAQVPRCATCSPRSVRDIPRNIYACSSVWEPTESCNHLRYPLFRWGTRPLACGDQSPTDPNFPQARRVEQRSRCSTCDHYWRWEWWRCVFCFCWMQDEVRLVVGLEENGDFLTEVEVLLAA